MHNSVASRSRRDRKFSGNARSLSLTASVSNDGRRLNVMWDRGSLVVVLYSSVLSSEVGAKMRRGTLILTMRKSRAAETWPWFERDVQATVAQLHEVI